MAKFASTVERELSLHVRCSANERDLWRSKAHASRVSLSQYLRDALNETPTPKRSMPLPVDAKLLQQIAAAGNNLNQIAKGVNQSGRLFLPLDLIALQTELVTIERQLAAVLQAHVR